jgi:K+-sensing histidine kinase KdpD
VPTANHRKPSHHARELHALTQVAKTLTAPLQLPALLAAVMNTLPNVLEPADCGTLMLWDQSAGLFRAEAAFGYDLTVLREMGLRAGESITGKAYDTGRSRLLANSAEVMADMTDMRPANRSAMMRALGQDTLPCSALAVPLHVGERKFGVLVLETIDCPIKFTARDLPFVETLAELIALAIDRARLEAEAEAIRDARQVDRLRSEVMATLSHELRTPLAAIKGYSTAMLLEEVDWPDEKRREFLHLIDDECENLQRMISDILDSSLIDVGQLVSISDQGVGISPEDLIPLFEKYFRVKSPTGYHVAGTGLGLPVARSIIEAHGGRIWAESKVGQGTTLYFSLPRSGLSAAANE